MSAAQCDCDKVVSGVATQPRNSGRRYHNPNHRRHTSRIAHNLGGNKGYPGGVVVWWGLLLAVLPSPVMADCNTGGIVAGCILGTLAFCFICLLIGYLIYKKRNKPRKARPASSPRQDYSHTNQAFTPDIEMGHTGNGSGAGGSGDVLDGAIQPHLTPVKEVPAYVACREHTSDPVNSVRTPVRSPASTQQHAATATSPSMYHVTSGPTSFLNKLTNQQHGGSHSSLDAKDDQIVDVALESQDVVGLGFNISGSLRDGIYVSQVHKRGPANESGQVHTGDRVLGITISLCNMVYEDALHILSYASPYPVSLRLLKAGSGATSTTRNHKQNISLSEDSEPHLLHPVYRSQSAADISTIGVQKITGDDPVMMRRARSEMKRGSSKAAADSSTRSSVSAAPADASSLRKWSNIQSDLQTENDSIVAETSRLEFSSNDTLDTDEPLPTANLEITTSEFMADFPDNSSPSNQAVKTDEVFEQIKKEKESSSSSSSSSSDSEDDSSSKSSGTKQVVSAVIETERQSHIPKYHVEDSDSESEKVTVIRTVETENSVTSSISLEAPPPIPNEAPPALPTEAPPAIPDDDPTLDLSLASPTLPPTSPPNLTNLETYRDSEDDNLHAQLSFKNSADEERFESLMPTIEIDDIMSGVLSMSGDVNIPKADDPVVEKEIKMDVISSEEIVPVHVSRGSIRDLDSSEIEFTDREVKPITDDVLRFTGNEDVVLEDSRRRHSSSSSSSDSDNDDLENKAKLILRRKFNLDTSDDVVHVEETAFEKVVIARGRKRKSTAASSSESSSSSESEDDGSVDVLVPPEMQPGYLQSSKESEDYDTGALKTQRSQSQESAGTAELDTELGNIDIAKLQHLMLQEGKTSRSSSRRTSTSSHTSSSSHSDSSEEAGAVPPSIPMTSHPDKDMTSSSESGNDSDDDKAALEGEPEANARHIKSEDESVEDALRDYYAGEPSLMEKLGIGQKIVVPDEDVGEGECDDVSDNEDKHSTSSSEKLEPVNDVELLNQTKATIRRHNSSSSNSSHTSKSSSSSSSDDEEKITETPLSPLLAVGIPVVDPNTPQPPVNRANGNGDASGHNGLSGSSSPDINRSSGGLSYDLTSAQINHMQTIQQQTTISTESSGPTGGVAYYVDLNPAVGTPPELLSDRPNLIAPAELTNHIGDECSDGVTTTRYIRTTTTTTTTTGADGDVQITERTVTSDSGKPGRVLANDFNDNELDHHHGEDGELTIRDLGKASEHNTVEERAPGAYLLTVSDVADSSEA